MGYRHYLYTIPKKRIKKIRNLTLAEMKAKYGDKSEEDWIDYKDVLKEHKCIFEYGTLYWDDTVERIHNIGQKLFTNKDVQEEFIDFDIYLVGKAALKVTIDIYKDKIIKMYEHLFDNKALTETEIKDKYESHLKEYQYWWTSSYALNLKEKDDRICDSWLYEHQIFELVRLYKIIDFEKYDLIFLGY